MGSVYIPRTLDLILKWLTINGGMSALRAYKEKGKSFLSFNLEQQGNIISDYFMIKDGYQPKWGMGNRHDLSVYESFVEQMKRGLKI